MTAYLSPIGNDQFIDANGNPLTGGKVYTYLAGTSTPAGTWTTSAGDVAQANPIILNSLGATANPIWLTAGVAYKFVIKDASDVQIGQPFDNITGINDPLQVALSTPEWMLANFAISYVSATVFSAAGDQTLTLPAGIRVKTTNTGGVAYSRVLTSVYSAGVTTVTLLNDSLTLDSGLSALSYSILSPTKPSLPNSQAVRDAMGMPNGVAKNLLKNASFTVNQDSYINGTPLAANTYGHDCWKAGALGCTYIAGGLQSVTVSAGALVQFVEIPPSVPNGTLMTLSGFTGTGQIDSTVGVSPLVYTYNGTPIIGVFLPIGTHSRLQLELGGTQTSFECVTPQQDLINCQRYHVRVTGTEGVTGWGVGRQSSTTASRIWINPPVPMYVKPTVAFAGVSLDYAGGATAATASTVYSSKGQVMMDVTHAAVGAAGQAVGLQIGDGAANYIELNARL